jgi:choloylglycine hydrolase
MSDGYLGLPGGSNSPAHFIRASVYSRDAYPGKTGADSVWTAWHVMNCFDVPRGILRNVASDAVESCEFALYIGVADTWT